MVPATDRPILCRRRRIVIWLSLVALITGYLGGYAAARRGHWLVHRSGYAAGLTDHHTIAVGDFGSGGNPVQLASSACHLVFTPLRWAEAAFWTLRHPPGGPWPDGGRVTTNEEA